MLLCNSKELIQNHVVWSYVIKIFKCLKNIIHIEMMKNLEFKFSVPEMFVRIENADIKKQRQGKN